MIAPPCILDHTSLFSSTSSSHTSFAKQPRRRRMVLVAMQAEESKNQLLSCKVLRPDANEDHLTQPSPANTVGVVGGCSVICTLIFLERLAWWSMNNGDERGLPFIVCNDPLLRGLTRSADIENLKRKTASLQMLGAKCIVIPCHHSLIWDGAIAEVCSLPFLSIVDSVVSELKAANLRPLEAGRKNPRIGVLTTSSSPSSQFYQEKLLKEGFEVVLPDKQTVDRILAPAIEAARKDKEGARILLVIAIHVLLVRAVNRVVLACDELQGLLPRNDPLFLKCINPLDCLARSTVMWARYAQKNH